MISPTHTISPEWQNENALRAYPLEDDAPAASRIPAWLVADMRVTCPPGCTPYISSVYVSPTLLSVAVSGRMEGAPGAPPPPPVGLLAKTVTRDELEPFRTYAMDRLSGAASGTVVFGEAPPEFSPSPALRLSFTADEAPLAQAAVARAAAPGVTGIADPAHGTSARGIIDLSGNSEFRTRVDPDDPHTIVVALTDMYRDLTTSVCDAVPSFSTCGETPVRTINGVPPTETGVIYLRFR